MSEYLGTVRNISAGRKTLDLHVFDDTIVVGKGDLKGMALRVAGRGLFGGAGFAAADQLMKVPEREAAAAVAATTPDDLVALDPGNRSIALADVKAIRLSHPFFPPIYRIDVETSDGRSERFEWKRLHNEPKDVAALFRRAVGDRATVAGH